VQRRAISRHEGQLEHAIREARRRSALQRGQRLAGQRDDFERALDPLGIGRLYARGGASSSCGRACGAGPA
jgi:hypothetical protein